jgi:hypothetical protein
LTINIKGGTSSVDLTFSEDNLLDQLVRFIIGCRLAFNVAEHIQFKRLLHIIYHPSGRSLKIPNRHQIRNRLFELAEISKSSNLSRFSPKSKMSIALDCWSSPDRKAFIGITGYFISDDFKYHEILLGFRSITGSHTGANLADIVLDVIQKNGLQKCIFGITTDNAANNGTLVDELQQSLKLSLDGSTSLRTTAYDEDFIHALESQHHFPCLSHVIQLAVNQFLKRLKITAKNDMVEFIWDEKKEKAERDQKNALYKHSTLSHGLVSTLEKVSKI